jgi:3-deoxy-D-manno-octulosonic-acid transferase
MLPQFLMVMTLIVGGAFANEGGHECIEEKGAKECVVGMLEAGTNAPMDQEAYNKTVND